MPRPPHALRRTRPTLTLLGLVLAFGAASAPARAQAPTVTLAAPAPEASLPAGPGYRSPTGVFEEVELTGAFSDGPEGTGRIVVTSDPAVDGAGRLSAEPVASIDLTDEQVDIDGNFKATAFVEGAAGRFFWQASDDVVASEVRSFTLTDPGPSPRLQATPSSVLGIRVGMTVAQARRATSVPLTASGPDLGGCRYFLPAGQDIAVMVIRGRVARFETSSARSGLIAPKGLQVGSPAAAVRARYGRRVRSSRHTYVRGGRYLDVLFRTGRYRNRSLRFETDAAGLVSKVIVGRTGPAQYVEGCA